MSDTSSRRCQKLEAAPSAAAHYSSLNTKRVSRGEGGGKKDADSIKRLRRMRGSPGESGRPCWFGGQWTKKGHGGLLGALMHNGGYCGTCIDGRSGRPEG